MVVNVEDSRYLIKMVNKYNVPPCVIVGVALDILHDNEAFYSEEIGTAIGIAYNEYKGRRDYGKD